MAQDSVGIVEHLLDVHGTIGASSYVITWKQGVLYAQHGWPVSIFYALHYVFLGDVCASIFYSNSCFQVVKMAAIQLKELNKQYAQILIRISGINTRMEL